MARRCFLLLCLFTLPLCRGQEIQSEKATFQLPATLSQAPEIREPEPVLTLYEKIMKESTYYALLIGIEKYKDPQLPNLDNPGKDVEKLHEILKGNYMFRDENIMILNDATRNDIINALDHLAGVVKETDNLLIFYAGHGWWDEASDIGYWLPSDATAGSKVNWFRNSTLVDYLKEIHSKHTLLITDACFGGSIFKSRAAAFGQEKAINRLYELPSRKAMTSGTLTEVPDRSAFAYYLIKYLKENKEMFLSSEQLFSSFRIAVINNSDALPQYGDIRNVGDQGGDFIFLKQQTAQ
ncbi:MAG: caspase family protein [Bacteroidota bacterium]